jgi:pimeloyl-ACP methyl ester carboxylesterase
VQRLLVGIAVAVSAFLLAGAGGATGGVFRPCVEQSRVLCATVEAPLDPAAPAHGSVGLHVEELPAPGLAPAEPGKVIFLVAGGPGQASAATFNLRDYGTSWQRLFPGYTLVAYDDRGTGGSGTLRCPGLAAIVTASPAATEQIVGACGRRLGARSALYSSRANAEDMDTIRQALGVEQVAVFGISYGTKQALAYALTFPSHVARLVLDSVVPPRASDPFYTDSLQMLPKALDEICHDACAGVTRNAGADFVTLANRLAARPRIGLVPMPGRRPARVRLDGFALLQLGLDTDLDPGIAAELAVGVKDGLAGDLGPLERLAALDFATASSGSLGINLAVNVATDCSDGRFFWTTESPVASRGAELAKAFANLPHGATGLFGAWAARGGPAEECLEWPPAPAAASMLPAGPLPNVPVLVLSGGRDIRTPTNGGRRLAAGFRRGRLLVVEGSGHGVTTQSACADAYVAAWVQGEAHGGCPPVLPVLEPLRNLPRSPVPGNARLSAAQTLSVASATLREAEATWLVAEGLSMRIGGLAGGVLSATPAESFGLQRYADVAGVAISGSVRLSPSGGGSWRATVTVSGDRAASGTLRLSGAGLRGELDGQSVSVRAAG